MLVISHERLSGQPQMGYIDSRPIADRIAATYPNAKILIVIREQRDMMLSVYKQHIMRFGKNTFDHMWRERTIREQRRPGPTYDMFEYHLMIGYYQKLFGSDRVLVLPFEMLKKDAVSFVGEIQKFAGLEAPAEIPMSKDNVALPGAAVKVVRIRQHHVPHGRHRDGVRRADRGQAQPPDPARDHPHARSDAPEELVEARRGQLAQDRARHRRRTFRASNKLVEEITGLDLGQYGYDLPATAPMPSDTRVDQGGR